jgi:hypothetical protein
LKVALNNITLTLALFHPCVKFNVSTPGKTQVKDIPT